MNKVNTIVLYIYNGYDGKLYTVCVFYCNKKNREIIVDYLGGSHVITGSLKVKEGDRK